MQNDITEKINKIYKDFKRQITEIEKERDDKIMKIVQEMEDAEKEKIINDIKNGNK